MKNAVLSRLAGLSPARFATGQVQSPAQRFEEKIVKVRPLALNSARRTAGTSPDRSGYACGRFARLEAGSHPGSLARASRRFEAAEGQ